MISIIGYKIISSSQIVALLAFSLVITECYYRTQIWLAFEFKRHKSTLKKVRKERSLLDKLLGLYTSKYSLAPHHMRRYKISRVIALSGYMILLMLAVCLPEKWMYVFDGYLICSAPIIITIIVDWIVLCFPGKVPDFDRSNKP